VICAIQEQLGLAGSQQKQWISICFFVFCKGQRQFFFFQFRDFSTIIRPLIRENPHLRIFPFSPPINRHLPLELQALLCAGHYEDQDLQFV